MFKDIDINTLRIPRHLELSRPLFSTLPCLMTDLGLFFIILYNILPAAKIRGFILVSHSINFTHTFIHSNIPYFVNKNML